MLGDMQLVQPYAGGKIVLKTFARMGGAISSLTWNGMEFVDAHDKGRLLQVSTHFGTPQNPNAVEEDEAGMASDPAGSSTTGVMGAYSKPPNWLVTKVHPSLYFGGGQSQDALVQKTVTLGLPGLPNVIDMKMTVFILTDKPNGWMVEAPTGYMPSEFDIFYTFANGVIKPIAATSQGVWGVAGPIVVENSAHKTAMGVIGLSRNPNYAIWLNCLGASTTKWTLYYGHPVGGSAGPQFFHSQMVIGPTWDVVATMQKLTAQQKAAA